MGLAGRHPISTTVYFELEIIFGTLIVDLIDWRYWGGGSTIPFLGAAPGWSTLQGDSVVKKPPSQKRRLFFLKNKETAA